MLRVVDSVFWGAPEEPDVEEFEATPEGAEQAIHSFLTSAEYVYTIFERGAPLPYSPTALRLERNGHILLQLCWDDIDDTLSLTPPARKRVLDSLPST